MTDVLAYAFVPIAIGAVAVVLVLGLVNMGEPGFLGRENAMQVLHEGLADSKYRPCPLLVKYVEAGWLGRKTQRGFYDYRGQKPVPTR